MIPPTTPTIATPILIQENAAFFPAASTKSAPSAKIAQHWQEAPLTSPDIQAPVAVPKVAQSELPGGYTPNTPVQAPPAPSIKDTGSGYPTNIPRNYFGPAVDISNGSTGVGVISRFPLSDNYSIRPSVIFGGNNGTVVRVPVTYDFVFGDKEPFERNPLVTFHAGVGGQFSSGSSGQDSKFAILGTLGVDVSLFESTALVASYNTDFGSINGVNIGLGFEF